MNKKELEMRYYELEGQLNLIKEIIYIVETRWKDKEDLMYYSSETLCKIMLNRFIELHQKILQSKHGTMLELYELINDAKRNEIA